MVGTRRNGLAALMAATLALGALTGCDGVPSQVTGALSGAGEALSGAAGAASRALDDLLGGTSVEQARAERRAGLVQAVSDSDLATPGTLTVGVKLSETAPLALSGAGGSPAGIDVDTAYALADELGLARVEFVSVQSAQAGLASGCDVVMGVREGESEDVAVLGGYAQSALGVFSADGAAAAPMQASDLAGATVGVQASSVSQAALANLDLGATETTYPNLNEAFGALSAGEVDYVVCDAYAGAYLACVSGGASFAGTLDAPVPVGVGVSADATSLAGAVGDAVEKIQSNGVAEVAKSRWVGPFPELTVATMIQGLP